MSTRTRFEKEAKGNSEMAYFYLEYSRTDHLRNSFSSIDAIIIWNSIPNSDDALPKSKFKDILQNQPLDILTQENSYVAMHSLDEIFSKY